MSLQEILENFLDHLGKLEELRLRRDDRYEAEFQQLKALTEKLKEDPFYICSHGEKEVNRPKNRYKDIVPYDYSRVVLTDTGIPESDYINASYIKGSGGCRSYIASQGPLPNTVDDFWRMIWECEVQIIVMASSEIEGGKHKCERYWVYEGEKCQFGNLEVSLVNLKKICGDFIVRTLKVRCQQEDRIVVQFHYVTWPDHGVPESVIPILNMVKLVRNCQLSENIPILVHCSAGCGRTGTICSIDYVFGLLRSGKLSEDFSLFQLISDMRRQRIAMVQTKEQYLLIHRAVKALFEHHLQIIETHPYENVDFFGVPIENADPQEEKSVNKKRGEELVSTGTEDNLLSKTTPSIENFGLQNYPEASFEFEQIPDLAIETVDPLLRISDEACDIPPLPEKIKIGNHKNKAQIKNDFPDDKAQSKVKKLISTWNTGNITNSTDEFNSVFDDAEVSSNNESIFDNTKLETDSKIAVAELSSDLTKDICCDTKQENEFYKQGNNYSEKAIIIRKPSIAKLKALFEKSASNDNSPCPSPEIDGERKQSLSFDPGDSKEIVPPKKRSLSPFKKPTEGNVAARYKDTALKLYSELKMNEKQTSKETEVNKPTENTVISAVPDIFRRVGSQRSYNQKSKNSVWYDNENASNEKTTEEKPALPVKRSKSMKVQSITENALGIFRRPSPLLHRRAETTVASYLAVEEVKKNNEMKACKQIEIKTDNDALQNKKDNNTINIDTRQTININKSNVADISADPLVSPDNLDSSLISQNLKGIQKENVLKPNRKAKQFAVAESIPGTSNPVQLIKIKEFENETDEKADSLLRKKYKKESNLTEECTADKVEINDLQTSDDTYKIKRGDKHYVNIDIFEDIPPPLPAKQNSPANSPHMRRSVKENQKKGKKKYPPTLNRDNSVDQTPSTTLENSRVKDKSDATFSESQLLDSKRISENYDESLDKHNKLKLLTTSENIPNQLSSSKYSDLLCSDPQKETCDQIIRDCQEYLNSTGRTNQDNMITSPVKKTFDSIEIVDEKKSEISLPKEEFILSETSGSDLALQKDSIEAPPVKVPRQKIKKNLAEFPDPKSNVKNCNQEEFSCSPQISECNKRKDEIESNFQIGNNKESIVQESNSRKEDMISSNFSSLTTDHFEHHKVATTEKHEENNMETLIVNLDEEEKLLQLLKADKCNDNSKADDIVRLSNVSNADVIIDQHSSVEFDLNTALGNLPKPQANSSDLISPNKVGGNKIIHDRKSCHSETVADKGYESLWLSETGHPVIRNSNEVRIKDNKVEMNPDIQEIKCEHDQSPIIQIDKGNLTSETIEDGVQKVQQKCPNDSFLVDSLSNLTHNLPFLRASSESPACEPKAVIPIRSSSCSPQIKSKWSQDRVSLQSTCLSDGKKATVPEEKSPVEPDNSFWHLKSCHLVKEVMNKHQHQHPQSPSAVSSSSNADSNRVSFSHTVKELHSLIDDLHLQVPRCSDTMETKQFSERENSEIHVIQQLLEELLVDSNISEAVKPKPYKPRPLPRSIIPAVFKTDHVIEVQNPEYAVVRKNDPSKCHIQRQKDSLSNNNGQTSEKHEYEELRLAVEGTLLPSRKENDYEEIRLQRPLFPMDSFTHHLTNNVDPSDDLEEPIHVSRNELFGIPDDPATDSPNLHIYERVKLDSCLNSTDHQSLALSTPPKNPNQDQKHSVKKYSDSELSSASKDILKQSSEVENRNLEIFKIKCKSRTVPCKTSSNQELNNDNLYTKVNKGTKQEFVGVVKRQVVDSPKLQIKGFRSRYSKDDMEISPLPPPRNKRNSGQRQSFLFEKATDSFWWTQTLPGRLTDFRRRRSVSELQPQWGEEWNSDEDCTPPVPVKTKDAYIIPAEMRASSRTEHDGKRKKVTSLTTPPPGDNGNKTKPGKFNFLTKIGLKATEVKDLEGFSTPVVVPVSQTTHVNYEGASGFVFPCRLPKKPKGPRPPPLSWKTERAGSNC